MTQSSHHPLPFPVSDASDLRRAIRHADSHGDSSIRRHIIQRARALGHMDLVPSAWTAGAPVERQKQDSLDFQFEQLGAKYGIGVAKLKAVYFRGVKEFTDSDIELGSATMYGLARVQRFINAVYKGAPMLADEDLVARAQDTQRDSGVEINIDAGALLSDVLYSTGARTAQLFEPGTVTSIRLEDDVLTVSGTLDELPWSYSLNTVSGAHELKID